MGIHIGNPPAMETTVFVDEPGIEVVPVVTDDYALIRIGNGYPQVTVFLDRDGAVEVAAAAIEIRNTLDRRAESA